MAFNISISDIVVSSKPGVSMRTTRRLENEKHSGRIMLDVHDFRPPLTGSVDPLTILMNYGKYEVSIDGRDGMMCLTDDLPTPVGPITLEYANVTCKDYSRQQNVHDNHIFVNCAMGTTHLDACRFLHLPTKVTTGRMFIDQPSIPGGYILSQLCSSRRLTSNSAKSCCGCVVDPGLVR